MKRGLAAFMLLMALLGNTVLAAQSSENSIEDAVASGARSDADRERDGTSEPVAVLSFFGVEPGMHVVDLLSGGGYYAEILSAAVGPEGKVIAHTNDIYEKYRAEEISRRYQDDRLANVTRLVSNPPDLKLPIETVDIVLMVMTYHDTYYVSESDPKHPKIDRERFLAQIYRCLKPGGVLAIVDHSARRGTGKESAQDLHRIDEEFARRDIESVGFVFDGESSVLRNPDDDRMLQVFDERIRRKTDRFVYRFVKPKAPE